LGVVVEIIENSVSDDSGKKVMHALNLQFAIHLLEQQTNVATSKVCASLSRKGFQQESKGLQIRPDKLSVKVFGRLRQLFPSTKLPERP
jgi:hypothetical protein